MTSRAHEKATTEGLRYLKKRKRTGGDEGGEHEEYEVAEIIGHKRTRTVRKSAKRIEDSTQDGRRVTRSQSRTRYAGPATRQRTLRITR